MMEVEERWKPAIEVAPNCPRCASSNTKFCYYNNYSLSQPRYFCKGCRRYWTKGGSLRNVPVGGGCRKTRRRKSSSVRGLLSSSSNSRDSSAGDPSNGPESSSSSAAPSSDIDMAAVFAKFLHHDAPAAASVPGGRQDAAVLEPSENNLAGNDDGFELDALLGERDHLQDVFWSSCSGQETNFSWQLPVGCLQELDDFPTDHIVDELQFPTADSVINDNWSSYDLCSGFEVFSRS